MVFRNREEAGEILAERLSAYLPAAAIVLALPRGGVPLGYIIAKKLGLPLDVILIKKIGYPGQPEYAVGAVSLQSEIINKGLKIAPEYLNEQIENIRYELQQRYRRYQGSRQPVPIKGKTVFLVDDGIATGYTMLAAAQLVRQANPDRVIIAVPVVSPSVLPKLKAYANEIVCLAAPSQFQAVGQFYHDFSEVGHDEVVRLLSDPLVQAQAA
ncbi:MAG: phosphoribosyltransferase [Adhaeribacter sp.]